MYDAQNNEPAKANTSDLNEELGQVLLRTSLNFTQELGVKCSGYPCVKFCSFRFSIYSPTKLELSQRTI